MVYINNESKEAILYSYELYKRYKNLILNKEQRKLIDNNIKSAMYKVSANVQRMKSEELQAIAVSLAFIGMALENEFKTDIFTYNKCKMYEAISYSLGDEMERELNQCR